MTRFERELSGSLGEFWKKNAKQEIRKMEERQLGGEIFFGADGVVRWTSNNRVMPKDCCEILSHTAYRNLFDEDASRAAEEAETAAFLESYRKSYKGPNEEEKAEMRAAFGEGSTVVDIITGKKIRL
ncbi:MAG: hypothetical protein J6I76_01285 [Oribacterium sp.]|nr:hypothetical protein [Oribacterium sp.]